MRKFFKQFSLPGGIGSHATPETPGSIREGGGLGYSVSHAFGTVFDNPYLITLTMVGDGESGTGPLATSWHSAKFLNPITDGAVLPVLHLNGYKRIQLSWLHYEALPWKSGDVCFLLRISGALEVTVFINLCTYIGLLPVKFIDHQAILFYAAHTIALILVISAHARRREDRPHLCGQVHHLDRA
jgi:hypothetical protein